MAKRITSLFERLFRKRLAYRTVFNTDNQAARIVLADLAKICPSNPARGAGSPIDEKKVFINIGRREVLNHIMGMVNLSDDKLNKVAQEEE